MDVEIDPDKTNPFEPATGGDDGDESFPMTATSSRRGSKGITNPSHHKTYGETSFIEGIDDRTPLLEEREDEVREAEAEIKKKYPNADMSNFFKRMAFGRVEVRGKTGKNWYPFFDTKGEGIDKSMKRKLTTVAKALGKPAEEIVRTNEREITQRSERVRELRTQLETASENQRETIDHQIDDLENEIDGLERENEEIEQRISLRDRVKTIFKKYGFTLVAVLTAVGTVIGVIVSNLKNGLTTLGKGVGDGLRSIGKKLGEILPGLVGAIASFIFKTAGEVIGFLGKNAWLLIMAVLLYFVEQFKKRR